MCTYIIGTLAHDTDRESLKNSFFFFLNHGFLNYLVITIMGFQILSNGMGQSDVALKISRVLRKEEMCRDEWGILRKIS